MSLGGRVYPVRQALLVSVMLWPAAGADYQPYLQRVTAESATVTWTAPEQSEGEVICAANRYQQIRALATASPMLESDSGQTTYRYSADLTGLDPGAEYVCRVHMNGWELGADAVPRVRTASRRPFRFLAFGDSGTGSPAQRQLARLMEQEDAAMAVHTGDIAYPEATFERLDATYFQVYARLFTRVPMFPSPGNHEYYAGGGFPYRATHDFPASEGVPERDRGRYYSFDWGPVHFISIDSVDPLRDAAQGKGQMLEWLEQDLRRTKQPWRIAYFHHPPYATGPNRGDAFSALARTHLSPLLERYGVQLVLNGHEHSYQRTHPLRGGQVVPPGEGTVYVVTGGGGAHLYQVDPAEFLARGESLHHYIRAEVAGDELRLWAIGTDGAEFDQTVLRLPSAPRIHRVTAMGSRRETFAPGGLIEVSGARLAAKDGQAAGLPLPQEIEGTRATLNGEPLPLLAVAPGRITAQLPFGCDGRGTLRVESPEGVCECELRLQPAAPALFAEAFHAGSARPVSVESPISPGGWATLFGTGLGEPAVTIGAGEAVPGSRLFEVRAEVVVLLGSEKIRPAFAGLSPGLAGVYQVDFQAPAAIAPGDYEAAIATGGKYSNTVPFAVR